MWFQAVAGADFTPVGEVQLSLVVAWEQAEKVVRDFFREESVGDRYITISMVGLEEVPVRTETVEELEAEVATLVEAVGIMNMIPVAAEEDLTMLGKISKTSVAIKQLAMVRWPLLGFKKVELRVIYSRQ